MVDFHMKRLLTRSSDLGLPAVSKCSVVLYLGVKKKKKKESILYSRPTSGGVWFFSHTGTYMTQPELLSVKPVSFRRRITASNR